jgi:hypothetical protein
VIDFLPAEVVASPATEASVRAEVHLSTISCLCLPSVPLPPSQGRRWNGGTMPLVCNAPNAFRVRNALTKLLLPTSALAPARPLSTSIAPSSPPEAPERAEARSQGAYAASTTPTRTTRPSRLRHESIPQDEPSRAQIDPTVNLDSLSDTLEAHRKANRDSIIRQVPMGPRQQVQRPRRGPPPRKPEKGFHHYDSRLGSKTAFQIDFRSLRNRNRSKSTVLDYEPVEIMPPLMKSRESWPWAVGADPTWPAEQRCV